MMTAEKRATASLPAENEDDKELSGENEFQALLEELEEKTDEWAGDWFVNVGECIYRTWDDCVKYGFMSAGQGTVYSNALKKLEMGSKIYAYISGHGYVGVGSVTSKAVPIKDFTVGLAHTPLLNLPLKAENPDENKDDPALSEWVIGVNWHQTVDKEDALRFVGAFANPQVVCKLRHRKTLDFLQDGFGHLAKKWFVNVGEHRGHLRWEDCRRYECISAGGDPKYGDALQRLNPGDTVYAYVSGAGYIGAGKVVKTAVPIHMFTTQDDTPLLKNDLATKKVNNLPDNPDFTDWVAGINWIKTFDREHASRDTEHYIATLCEIKTQID